MTHDRTHHLRTSSIHKVCSSNVYQHHCRSSIPNTVDGLLPSGTEASSGFAKPSGNSRYHLHSGNASCTTGLSSSNSAGALLVTRASGAPTPTSTTGRLPFSTSAGLVFTNRTSAAPGATETVVPVQPSGTGISSGFAKPTGKGLGNLHSANSSKLISATGRLPFSKSATAMPTNATSTSLVLS
jgi:hypothetical protein